ncbi:NDR1/HIN1-like protein 12 [Telopea speciosissima]|uniref:NDR1/HIN1-like protein 12 n=1 Tax=Telopea speciosissima TaxID=54955 RepID=UPI001CC812BC|nr:NDR1/HIN1-like protein 12 [Telopea speciosissima]
MSEEVEPNSGSAEVQKQGGKMTKEKANKGRYAATHLRHAVWTFLAMFVMLVGVTALILWIVYRPHKPQFTVVNAVIYDLNITSPPIISTTMQFTIVTRNLNRRVSISYDRLSAFVSYRNQEITPPTVLTPLFQERHSTVALSPILGGRAVPVSMEVVNGLVMDEGYGVVGLRLVVLGRLRWKAGPFWSGHHRVYVKCGMLVGLKKGFVGQVPLFRSSDCRVDI